MPIKFECQHCGQVLRVASRKAGKRGACPQCRRRVTVPDKQKPDKAKTHRPQPPPPPSPDNSLEQFAVYDEVDLFYQDDAPAHRDDRDRAQIDYRALAVPRHIIYAQGVLLGVVALSAFFLGWALGNSRPAERQATHQTPRPCFVSGSVQTKPRNKTAVPDLGAVVIILPQGAKMDEKIAIDGLRPHDQAPRRTDASIRAIVELGGDYARADADGRFKFRVADVGDYYLLVISRNSQRRSDQPFNKADLVEMGGYFSPALDLLDEYQFLWSKVRIAGNRTLEPITFD